MRHITYSLLRSLVPRYIHRVEWGKRQEEALFLLAIYLERTWNQHGITTVRQRSHFLGQCAVETRDFTGIVEEGANTAQYQTNPGLGNTQPGDGARFIGRGLLQITGRWNYGNITDQYNDMVRNCVGQSVKNMKNPVENCFGGMQDFLAHPGDIALFPVTIDAACLFWVSHGCNKIAEDTDDVAKVTAHINAMLLKLTDRKMYTAAARKLLDAVDDEDVSSAFKRLNSVEAPQSPGDGTLMTPS